MKSKKQNTIYMSDRSSAENLALRSVSKKAGQTAKDPRRLSRLLEESQQKLKKMNVSNEKVRGFIGMIKTFIRMIRAYLKGSYRVIPWKTLLLMVGALIYFVTPLDLIPDFIPIAGFVDDISVVIYIFNRLKQDVQAFEKWEQGLAYE